MSVVGRCIIPLPFHLCVKSLPKEPKILFWEKTEKKCFSVIGQVMDGEKYHCIVLKSVVIVLSGRSGNVNWMYFRGLALGSLYLYLWYN